MRIDIRRSGWVAGFILAVHLAALAAVVVTIPDAPWILVTLPWLLWSGIDSWSRFAGNRRIRRLELTGEGDWLLYGDDGVIGPARLQAGSFVSSRLLVLHFISGRRRREVLILTAENAGPGQLRRLRIHLLHRERFGRQPPAGASNGSGG